MQISLEWLSEFLDLSNYEPEQIANALTMSGLEVEEIQKFGAKFTNIITAKIENIENHPDSDHLHLVTINTGKDLKTVVCGAQNIQIGQIVPFATIGSKVLNRKTNEQFELTPIKIRGIASEGMLCSSDELGLSDKNYQEEDGILILNRFLKDLKLGEPLEKVLKIKEDYIFTTAPTANRGDEMSVLGVARELSSLFNQKLNFSELKATKDFSTDKFKVEIIDKDVCGFYSIGLLKDVKIQPSPSWMKERLEKSGIRAINNIVDITNYVLLEYGIPLHAFDFDKLDGYLCVRRAKPQEKIVTLDNVERDLTMDSVLIATKEKGVCCAGVFGGNNSEIDENTKNIALEAAYFYPATTRKSARSIGYRSEASARFERGVDIEAIKPALMRAMQLLIELAQAKIEGIVETGENTNKKTEITLRHNQVKKILGIEIEQTRYIEILENLGFELLGKNEIASKFKVPSYRFNDVSKECDLIEEIARINGYDKITPTLPDKTQSFDKDEEYNLLKKVSNLFLGLGFFEGMSSSLIGEPLLNEFGLTYDKQKVVKVNNAQSEDFCMLRQSLIPNMLQAIKYNFDNGVKNVFLYEIGKIYFKIREATEIDTGVEEKRTIAGFVTGDINENKWITKPQTDFYRLKGVIENLIRILGLETRIRYEVCDDVSYLHPAKSAKIILMGKQPEIVGVFGQVHPIIKDKQKFLQDVFIFEINLEKLLKVANINIKYKKISPFPEVQRDIAFVVKKEITCEQISKLIKKAINVEIFNGSEIFDIYQGENIEKDHKSMAFRIKMQDKNATLTDDIVENNMKNLKAVLAQNVEGITFRE